MFIKNQKELKKYLSTKTDIFSQKKKTPMINQDLTKVINKTLKSMNLEHSFHAKNTFFYDEYSRSFMVFEHLLLTPKGIFVFNYAEMDCIIFTCPIRQTKVMSERLSYLLQSKQNELIPVFYYCVNKKQFPDKDHLVTLKELSNKFLEHYNDLPSIASIQKIATLRTLLLENQKQAVENKSHLYSLDYSHSFSFDSDAVISDEFKRCVLYDINDFVSEFAPESVIFSNLQLPVQGLKPIDFLIVSYKGILVLNTLEGYARYEGSLDDASWTRIVELENNTQNSTQIENLALLSVKQLQVLSQIFNSDQLPETFRVVCQTPIQCKIKHKSIIDDKHLEHHLDRYIANTETLFDELDIKRVVSTLNKLTNKKEVR